MTICSCQPCFIVLSYVANVVLQVELECDVARTDTVVNNFHPNHSVVHHNPHKTSSTHYTSDVKFYSDGTFFKELKGNPLTLKTG